MKYFKFKNFRIVLWGMIYWATLIFSYVRVLQIHWSSSWPLDVNIFKIVFVSISIVLMLLLVPDEESILSLFIIILLYVVVIPIGAVYSCQNKESIYYIFVFICFIVVESLLKKVCLSGKTINCYQICIHKRVEKIEIIRFFFTVIVCLTIFVMFQERGHPNIISLDLSKTYEIRGSYKISTLCSTLFEITTKALIPFLIASALYKNDIKKIFVLLTVQFIFFLWLANKTTLFSIIIIIFGYILAKGKRSPVNFSKIFALGILIISLLEFSNIQEHENIYTYVIYFCYSLIVRRMILLPAYLKYCYYNYFVLQDNMHEGLFGTFAAPFLTRFGVHPYYEDFSYSQVIGHLYLNDSDANTGIFGAEFVNFGFFGVFVASILLFILLLCVKKCEITNGKIFTCCVAIYTIFGLVDTSILRMVDYSPMFLTLLILYFYKITKKQF